MPMEKNFSATEAEARISKMWLDTKAFAAGANAAPKPDGSPAETFSIVIPPPNVTGSLHMGHAFNNTLQDILTRWHRMRGHDTLWQPGTDHAGIATQMVVERELMLSQQPGRRELGREKFIAKVWEQKRTSRANIVGQLQRLGASCDWDREAFTMSGAPGAPAGEEGNFHDAVIKVFVEMYNKGLIYRGKRLVNWDPHFETAISDLEVEQTEVDGHMWHFKYPLAGGATYDYVEKDENGTVTLRETRDYISIATTRPETMLGDGAVAVHPSDERYKPIVGQLCEIPVGPKEHRRLIPIITDEYPDPSFGSGAVKITGAHDFNDYGVARRSGIPLYRLMDTKAAMRADGVPYAEAATTAQAMSRAWLIRKGYATAGLIEQPMHLSAAEIDALNLVPDDLRGLDRYDARKRVVAQIEAEGLSVTVLKKSIDKETGAEHLERVPYIEDKKIMQPHGDRSKVVIEPMLTDQWFVATDKIVQPAIDAVRDGRTKILPEQHEKVYFHWLENIEPWCISRQLWWGHQIPVWYGADPEAVAWYEDATDAKANPRSVHPEIGSVEAAKQVGLGPIPKKPQIMICATDQADATLKAQAVYGDCDVLFQDETEENTRTLGGAGPLSARTNGRRNVTLLRDKDVLDTWFSSGLWPIGTLGWPEQTPELAKYFPTSVLVTGFDIIFYWVARMMMMQLAIVGDVPFHTVYLHSLVRDEKGKKMSKSLGNVLDPLDLIDEYGTDAVRFTLTAMAAMGRDLKLSKDRIAGYRNFGTKLWNATRFAEMNGVFDPERTHVKKTSGIRKEDVQHTVNKWIIGETARARLALDDALENFRFNDAANGLYAFVWGKVCDWYVEFAKPLMDGAEAQETRATMAWVLDQCYLMLHPIMPFITEDLWAQTATRAKPLVHGDWPTYGTELIDENAEREMNWVIDLITAIRSVRAEMGVPVGLRLPIVMTAMDDAGRAAFTRNAPMIDRLARLDGLTEGAAPKGAVTVPVVGGAFALPLAGVIDVAAEKSRLSKALEKLQKEIGGLNGRLNNPNFAVSAPAEIVEEARENLGLRMEEAAKLTAALQRLADMG